MKIISITHRSSLRLHLPPPWYHDYFHGLYQLCYHRHLYYDRLYQHYHYYHFCISRNSFYCLHIFFQSFRTLFWIIAILSILSIADHVSFLVLGAFQLLLMGLARTGNIGTVATIIWGKLVHASIAMKNRKPRRK